MKFTNLKYAFLGLLLIATQLVFVSKRSIAEDAAGESTDLSRILTTSTVDGKTLYEKLCISCHGETGIPSDDIKKLLEPEPAPFVSGKFKYGESLADVSTSIRDGRSDTMLGYRNTLTDEQIMKLAEYVRTLSGVR